MGSNVRRHRTYEGVTAAVVALIKELSMGTTAIGEDPAALGGRGLEGWRS